MKTTFESDGIDIEAEIFEPTGSPNGVIVIAHGSDGMKEPWGKMIRGYGKDLARLGFVAVIPSYFQKTDTSDNDGMTELITTAPPSRRDEWQTVVADAVAYAKTLPGVDSSGVGLLGFSLGGHLCLRLRSLSKVLVEFFAPEFPEFGGIGSGGNPSLHALIHHGESDPPFLVPLKPNAESIERELKKEISSIQLIRYPNAGHGFVGGALGGTDAGNAKARTESKESTLKFFTAHL